MNNELKKIGILTLSASNNVGSLLQTYALQSVVNNISGMKAEIINFNSDQSKNMYNIFPKNCIKHPKRTILSLFSYRKLKNQKKDYNYFRKKYLSMTNKEFCSEDELRRESFDYYAVISGSDQVWNINMEDFDEAFFLGWVKNASKIAYAPSLGGSNFTGYKDPTELKNKIKAYSNLSTREINGQKAIYDLMGVQVPVLADPTLLLNKEEWDNLVGEPFVKKEYIFYYSWSYNNDKLNRIVSNYAKRKGMDVYVINASRWIKTNPGKYGFKLFEIGGPIAFLNLMKYAQKVFVQSFHGVIFANIFERNFYFLNEHENGDLDSRLNSILTLLERKDRVVRTNNDLENEISIDYSTDNSDLKILIEKSFDYLKNALYVK